MPTSELAQSFPNVVKAAQYVDDVLSGAIDACSFVRLACQRHMDDLARQNTEGFPYYFDPARAEKPCFAVELLPHIKGKWAGSLIQLEPWQAFIVTTVFGWIDTRTNKRRFRTVYIEVPRKNAKSTLTAAIGLYMAFCDGEAGAEAYSAATTRDQAKIVFNAAQEMTRRSPAFRNRLGIAVNANNINQISSASKFEPLSAEGNSLDGLNTHFAGIDELHAHKQRAVFDVMETSTGARDQPLLWSITTAGFNRAGICWEQRSYLIRVLQNRATDETYWGCVWTIDEDDDWTDPAVWQKANPNFNVSVYPDDIERLCAKAKQMPSAQNNFLTKRLNVWVHANTAWMNMLKWDALADESLTLEAFEGEPCWVALDLASKIDVAALVLLFKKVVDNQTHYYVFGRYYLPQETVYNSSNSQYSGWVNEGRLTVTPGNIIDFDHIEDELRALASRFTVTEVPYDPFQATQLSTRMQAEGFPMVEVRPTVFNFSEPMKELEALVVDGRIHHDGCPILSWMMSNVVAHYDAKDNIYPRKEHVDNKIDGVVALIMALNRAITQEQPQPSVYATRGVISL